MTRSFDLAIDTAGDHASLALAQSDTGEGVTAVAWRIGTNATRELLARLDTFLADAGVTRDQIARIAVDVGPGQYGALRAGIATAQGLAVALDVPLAPVSRLEADAALVLSEAHPLVIAVHDTRGRVAWAAYALPTAVPPPPLFPAPSPPPLTPSPLAGEGGGGGSHTEPPGYRPLSPALMFPTAAPHELIPPAITTPEEAIARAPRGATWTGELSDTLLAAIARDADAQTGDTIEARPSEPRAVALLWIARARDAYGDPGSVDAIYLRQPPITPPREQ